MRTFIFRVVVLTLSLVSFPSCGNDGNGKGSCDQFNWRSETPNQIVCPYAPDCACPTAGVCCANLEGTEIIGASCSDLAACSGLAFLCDGPEDCNTGEVCCALEATGGGSSCKALMDCVGLDEYIMCRQDDDCNLGQHCTPAGSGGYLEGVAGFCLN